MTILGDVVKINLFFIGLPASGKSYFGEKLSLLIHYEYIDTDYELKESFNSNNDSNLSISEIYKKIGEYKFRNLEREVLSEIIKLDNKVVSTGGGIIESKKNIDLIKKRGYIIYLKTPIDVIDTRIRMMKPRELFKNGIKNTLIQLSEKREKIYEEVSDSIVLTENRLDEDILFELLKIVEQFG